MRKFSTLKLTALFLVATLLSSCNQLSNNSSGQTIVAPEPSCPPLPVSFAEIDLIGEWILNYSPDNEEILIIKGDGTYKQIYENLNSGLRYESDWKKWELEYRESGYVRLHLYGMRRAGETDSVFFREEGGVDPELFTAIDYCENVVIEMPDEIILIVTGADDNVPRSIVLRQVRLAGSEWTWSFSFKE